MYMWGIVPMDDVGCVFQRRADGALPSEHDALRDKSQERVLYVAHVFFTMVYPSPFHERIAIVTRNAPFTLDVAKDGEAFGLL